MKRYFKNIDKRSTLSPDEKSWIKLEQKLDKRRFRRSVSKYRNIAIAAVGLFLITLTILLSVGLEKDSEFNQTSLSANFVYQLEDLDASKDAYYSTDKIKVLSQKYIDAGLLQN